MSGCPSPFELQEYLEGRLRSSAAELLTAHLCVCYRCRELADRLALVRARLRSVPPLTPPASLLPDILHSVSQAPAVMPVPCEAALELMSAYFDDEMEPQDSEALEVHLFACDSCYRVYAATRTIVQTLRAQPAAAPSERLQERILARVAATQRQVIGRIFWRRVAVSVSATAAAAAVIFGLALQPAFRPRVAAPGPTTVAQRPPLVAAQPVSPALTEPPGVGPVSPPAKMVPVGRASAPAASSRPRMLASSSSWARRTGISQAIMTAPASARGPITRVVRAPLTRPDAPVAATIPVPWTSGADLSQVGVRAGPVETTLPTAQPAMAGATHPPKATPSETLLAQLPSAASGYDTHYVKPRAATTTLYRASADEANEHLHEAGMLLRSRMADQPSPSQPGVSF